MIASQGKSLSTRKIYIISREMNIRQPFFFKEEGKERKNEKKIHWSRLGPGRYTWPPPSRSGLAISSRATIKNTTFACELVQIFRTKSKKYQINFKKRSTNISPSPAIPNPTVCLHSLQLHVRIPPIVTFLSCAFINNDHLRSLLKTKLYKYFY